MRERPRPEPPSPRPFCFCFNERGKRCVALGVAAALAAAFALRWTTSSSRHERLETGDASGLSAGARTLPRCFSSAQADPSVGAWRATDNGERDSPARSDGWSLPTHQFDFLGRCDVTWSDEDHPGPAVPRPYWEWEPAKCSLDAVDEAKFCRVMEGRKGLLLVGDSLTRLMTTTLASILRADGVSLDTFKDDWEACGGALKVRFMRNDFLDTRTSPRYKTLLCERGSAGGPTVNNTRCRIFATDETLGEFDTLVVNSGAHPRAAHEFGRQMDAASAALTKSMHRLHGKDKAVLVVRNTIPGHWDCTERTFDGPVNETLAAELVDGAPVSYQWNTFHDRNAQLEKAFSAKKGWRLLDGPADHWVTLLYNILLDATGVAE